MNTLSILPEWFRWGESDLFWIGIALIIIGVVLPFHKESQAGHLFRALALLAVYAAAELALAKLPGTYLSELLMLFIGGGCLAVGCGRLVRWVIELFRPAKNGTGKTA